MLTKYFLHIGEDAFELGDEDLRNWDEIRCSYKREGYDGVVRSFTSQFEFVNRAKEILTELYLEKRFSAKASISVWTMNDRWEYEKRFECPLDFSTIVIEDYSLKLNSVDNSLAALIKASKGTKYEFPIGSDIKPDKAFYFDRLPMHESITYEFTQGESDSETGELTVEFQRGELPYVGVVNDEVAVNRALYWQDDQTTDVNSYLLRAERDVEITLDYEMTYRSDFGAIGTDIYVRIRRNGAYAEGVGGILGRVGKRDDIVELDNGRLPDPEKNFDKYAVYDGFVYHSKFNPSRPGDEYYWENTGFTPDEFFIETKKGQISLNLHAGEYVVMTHEIASSGYETARTKFVSTKFTFGWIGRGETVPIDVFTPVNVARTLLNKIGDGNVNIRASFSGYDPRLDDTFIIAAESARGIPEAKFYSSFNEFCDWMSAVFGYIYYIGDVMPSRFKYRQTCGRYVETSLSYNDSDTFTGAVDIDNITYVPRHGKFFYHEPGSNRLYPHWAGSENYNDAETWHARTDTLFIIRELSPTNLYYFDSFKGMDLYPQRYEFDDLDESRSEQTVHFVHRSELFGHKSESRKITSVRDLKYSVDSSVIYSAVTIGYDKKDYDNVNGRDEFNFNNTYSTGCSVSDKTLSLLSKYRADCYGLEFAVQKRGKDTTDSESDQDVFFVKCVNSSGRLVPDRSIRIENSITDQIFNGAFSPMACLRANEGYIGLMADSLKMEFASSTGNSEIVIGGIAMNAGITLDSPIVTNGIIDFSTDDAEAEIDANELIEVENDGVIYRGYIKEVDVKYAKTEAVGYKLIVKEIVT